MSKTDVEEQDGLEETNPVSGVGAKTEDDTDKRFKESPAEKREQTRSKIALVYTWCFFVCILLGFIYCCCHCSPVSDVKEMMLGISGILSGPLGFIIGYYFKSVEE